MASHLLIASLLLNKIWIIIYTFPPDVAEARRHLASRLNRLAKEHGFTFNKTFIRRQKTG